MSIDEALPPNALDAEQCLLGAVLLSADAVDAAAEILTAPDFYRPGHGVVFTAALAVHESGRGADPVAVGAELDRRGQLAGVGGLPYLHTLMASVPTAINAGYYAELILDAALRRRLMEAGQLAQQRATSGRDACESIDATRADLDRIATGAQLGVEVTDIGTLAADAMIRYGTTTIAGLSTPWPDLDDCLNGGLRPGTVTVVGARPGQGKSLWGANLAVHTAQDGKGALFVSLEMPREELTDRIVSRMARVTYGRLLTGKLTDDDWSRVEVAVDKLNDSPLMIVDHGHQTLAGIRSLARSTARGAHGLALLVVDYVQLMQPTDPRAPRQEQVAATSRGLKLLAKDLDLAVVVLSQLNRMSEARADKKPSMAELRESGQLEADADHVVLLHVPEDEARAGEIDFLLAKNRRGTTATITAGWAPHFQEIRSMAAAR